MVKINGTTIQMTRGDTLRITVSMEDEQGQAYIPVEGDVIRFAMKSNYIASEPLIEKVIDHETMQLELLPEDTKSLRFGKYVYDIEITFADGVVDTFIPCAELYIMEEVD